MLKNISRLVIITALFLTSVPSFADFNLNGKLKLTLPSGTVKELDFPLSYTQKEYDHTFVVGSQSFKVSGQPESYSFAVLLKSNNYVWIQEFSKDQFESFSLTLGEHKFNLKKQVLNKPVKGDYIMTIDGKDYFFQHTLAQINFKFDDDGITEISVDGLIASLGINTSKDPCDEFEDGSDEKKECEFNK